MLARMHARVRSIFLFSLAYPPVLYPLSIIISKFNVPSQSRTLNLYMVKGERISFSQYKFCTKNYEFTIP